MKTCPRCGSQKFWSLSAGQIRCSNSGLTRKVVQILWKKKRISPYWNCLWYLSRYGKVLTFPITSRAKETMQPYINKYIKTGSFCHIDD